MNTASGADADPVRLVALSEDPIDVNTVLAALDDQAAGGLSVFIGRVRDHDHNRAVADLEYSAHPTAAVRLREVCTLVAAAHDVHAVAAVHRVGALRIGDIAVVAAVAAAHRGSAFDAARDLIDTVKAEVPIWKHQRFADGTEEWVGTP